MKLASAFKLGAHTWKVKYKKMPDLFGLCDSDNHIIYISTDVNGRPTSEIQQMSSLIHEVGHAVLHTMGMDDNEQFIIAVEELVLQIILSMRYPIQRKNTKQK